MTMTAPAPNLLTPWLWQIIRSLCGVVAARGGRDHAMIPFVNAAWTRLSRTAQRFERLVARVLAGRAAPVRPAGLTRAKAVRNPAAFRLPSDVLWLGVAIPETNQYRGQVETLLADPAMAALLAAEPAAVRILRPLCRMLGIEQSLAGSKPPRPKKPPRPPEPPPAVKPSWDAPAETQAATAYRPAHWIVWRRSD